MVSSDKYMKCPTLMKWRHACLAYYVPRLSGESKTRSIESKLCPKPDGRARRGGAGRWAGPTAARKRRLQVRCWTVEASLPRRRRGCYLLALGTPARALASFPVRSLRCAAQPGPVLYLLSLTCYLPALTEASALDEDTPSLWQNLEAFPPALCPEVATCLLRNLILVSRMQREPPIL
ncbi:TPA: hypothetical protein BOS_3342 [Bos taurus]|nr:TPA: hypothetical protein BOS_3342 [Bos taurus]